MPPTKLPESASLFGSRTEAGRSDAPAGASTESKTLVAHIDGGARGNPGPSGYGAYLQNEQGRPVAQLSRYLGRQTNNFAEYSALVAVLEYALQHGFRVLRVFSDSELLVRQIKGIYKVRNEGLRPLYQRAQELILQLEDFRITHVRREQNREADQLANQAMDEGSRKRL